jgi:hypothetical protein
MILGNESQEEKYPPIKDRDMIHPESHFAVYAPERKDAPWTA